MPGIDARAGVVQFVYPFGKGFPGVRVFAAFFRADYHEPRVDGAARVVRKAHAAAHARYEADNFLRIVRQAQVQKALDDTFAAVQAVLEMFHGALGRLFGQRLDFRFRVHFLSFIGTSPF